MQSDRILFGEADCKKIVAHAVLGVIRVKPNRLGFPTTLMSSGGVAGFTSASSIRPRGWGNLPAGGQGQANNANSAELASSVFIEVIGPVKVSRRQSIVADLANRLICGR